MYFKQIITDGDATIVLANSGGFPIFPMYLQYQRTYIIIY